MKALIRCTMVSIVLSFLILLGACQPNSGQTADELLRSAISLNDLKSAGIALQNGANALAKHSDGQTALDLAVEAKSLPLLLLLVNSLSQPMDATLRDALMEKADSLGANELRDYLGDIEITSQDDSSDYIAEGEISDESWDWPLSLSNLPENLSLEYTSEEGAGEIRVVDEDGNYLAVISISNYDGSDPISVEDANLELLDSEARKDQFQGVEWSNEPVTSYLLVVDDIIADAEGIAPRWVVRAWVSPVLEAWFEENVSLARG